MKDEQKLSKEEVYAMTTGGYLKIGKDQTYTLLSRDYKDPQCVSYGINGDKAGTLDANYYKGCGEREGVEREVVAQADGRQHYIVRRLTPLECERLQGFPDGWTDIGEWTRTDKRGKEIKVQSADSVRYKALGNSIAIPPWFYVLQRLSIVCGADKTMASLFDGIGGFPLIWDGLHGAGSCVWASEIEDFPIAVTAEHFIEEAESDENKNIIYL